MEEFFKKIEKEYGIDKESFKKLAAIGVVAVILACIGIFWLLDSMKVKTLPYNELKAKVEKLWTQAQSKGATTEAQYRQYILERLTKVNYRQYKIDVSETGVQVIDKVGNMNKYGFFFDLPYKLTIVDEDGLTKVYVLIFHEDGTADSYSATPDNGFILLCDEKQNEKNLKYGTRSVNVGNLEGQFSADGYELMLDNKYQFILSFDSVHGIYREYEYVGLIEGGNGAVILNANGKMTVTRADGTLEMQVRTDADGHRIIYEGRVYATMTMDGYGIKIDGDILQIKETPYRQNIELAKYPGMKVKLVEGSTLEKLKAGKPKTGDIIMYNDYTYVCNKHYVNEQWVVFNEDEANPEWGVHVTDISYALYPDIESEIFGVPVTMLTSTYEECVFMQQPPNVSENAREMINTYYNCGGILYAPKIPAGVVNMTNTFNGCEQLRTASSFPENVKVIEGAYENCEELVTGVKIPSKVVNMKKVYAGCAVLGGTLKIDSKVLEDYTDAFYRTEAGITLTGKCPEETLRLIAETSRATNIKLASDPEVDTGDGFTDINE